MQSIIIMRKKFQEDVVELVNKAGLPAFIMRETFEKMIPILEQIEAQQLQEAIKEEEESAKKEEQKDG